MTAFIEKVAFVDLRDEVEPGDDAVFVAVHGAGKIGWYGPVSTAVANHVESVLAPAITGFAATDHQALQHRLRSVTGERVAPITSWAIGVVDCAVWDLHGRITERPVASLLGPTSIPTIAAAAYASWLRLNLRDPGSAEHVAQVSAQGWPLSKWGLRRADTGSNRSEAERLTTAANRAADAASAPIAFDAVGTWNVDLTCAFTDSAERGTFLWLEDALPGHDLPGYERITQRGLPVAVGERLHVGENPKHLLRAAAPTAFTLDVVGCGGLTRAVDLVAHAREHGVPVYPHGRSLQPAIHLAAAFPDVVAGVEYRIQWEPRRQKLYAQPVHTARGQLRTPSSPGLGTEPRRQPCRTP